MTRKAPPQAADHWQGLSNSHGRAPDRCIVTYSRHFTRNSDVMKARHEQISQTSRGDRIPMTGRDTLVAGFGLTVALLSAGVDGYLTADQCGDVWPWLCSHLPNLFHTGLLGGLAAHWPRPRLSSSAWQWLGIGLTLTVIGKAALLPILRRASRMGRRTVTGVKLMLALAAIAGGIASLCS